MSTVTAADTLAVLKLLVAGRSIDFVADATGVDAKLVLKFAETHGWPDKTKLNAAVAQLENGAATAIPVRAPAPHLVAKTPHPQTSRPATTPAQPRPAPGPAPGGTYNGAPPPRPPLTVDELVRACRRSESKRTQALGPKLAELADRVTTALRTERETAEAKAKQAEEFAAKKAAVDRLAKQLAEARAALRELKPSGVTEAALDFACEDCGDVFATSSGRARHHTRKHKTKEQTTA